MRPLLTAPLTTVFLLSSGFVLLGQIGLVSAGGVFWRAAIVAAIPSYLASGLASLLLPASFSALAPLLALAMAVLGDLVLRRRAGRKTRLRVRERSEAVESGEVTASSNGTTSKKS